VYSASEPAGGVEFSRYLARHGIENRLIVLPTACYSETSNLCDGDQRSAPDPSGLASASPVFVWERVAA
jgi:hypothetical protein